MLRRLPEEWERNGDQEQRWTELETVDKERSQKSEEKEKKKKMTNGTMANLAPDSNNRDFKRATKHPP